MGEKNAAAMIGDDSGAGNPVFYGVREQAILPIVTAVAARHDV
jgi:hypothetical protein